MLQWMGGSRRKVAASRRSIQKRQKQYFEQRKRQQQQHEAAFVEDNVDALGTSNHHKENRSLDILSLLNVPKATEECRPQCGNENISTMVDKATSARSSEVMDSTNHQPFKSTPTTLNHEVPATDLKESTVARTPSSHLLETMSSESPWRSTSTIRSTDSKCPKNAFSNQLSIFDLIGDDGAINASEGNPTHEAHVAFSIEGLGNIGTETPMQSPQRPGRRLSGDKSSFTKVFKKPHLFKVFNTMQGDLGTKEECLEDAEKPSQDYHLDLFRISEDVLHPFSFADRKQSTLKDGVQLDEPFRMNSLHEQDRHRGFWNVDSPFLDDGGNDNKCGLNWRNGISTDNTYSWRNDSPDLKFEGCNLPLRCQKEVTNTGLDEGDSLFPSVDDPKDPSFMCNYGPQAGYSSPVQKPWEDPRDTLTSVSAESCSSSAVRSSVMADVPSGRCGRGFVEYLQRPLKSSGNENYGEWLQNRAARSMRQGEQCDRSRKYTSNFSHSKPAYFSSATFDEKLVDGDPWLLDEGFPLSNDKPHPGSFYPSSQKNRRREGDLFGNGEEIGLLHSTKCSFGRCEKDTEDELSSENPASCQPFCSRKQFFSASGFPKAGSGESWLGLNHEFDIHFQSSNSLDAGFFGEVESATPIPDLSAQESVTEGGGDKPKCWSPAPEKTVEVTTVNKNITPESSSAGDANSKESGMSPDAPKKVVPQDTMAYSSDEDVNETSFSAKTPAESYEEVITEEFLESIPAKAQQNPKGPQTSESCLESKSYSAFILIPFVHSFHGQCCLFHRQTFWCWTSQRSGTKDCVIRAILPSADG